MKLSPRTLLFDNILRKIIVNKLSLFNETHSSHTPTIFSFITDSSAQQPSHLSIVDNRQTFLVDSLKEARSIICNTQGHGCMTSFSIGVEFSCSEYNRGLKWVGGNIVAVSMSAAT